jgi:hypothetical protein
MKPLTHATGLLLLFSFLLFHFSSHSSSLNPEMRGLISGTVIDCTDSISSSPRKPVRFALVAVKLNGMIKASAYTDSNGFFRIKNLVPGIYTVQCQALYFRGVTSLEVLVKAAETASVTIRLTHVHLLQKLEAEYKDFAPDTGNDRLERKKLTQFKTSGAKKKPLFASWRPRLLRSLCQFNPSNKNLQMSIWSEF